MKALVHVEGSGVFVYVCRWGEPVCDVWCVPRAVCRIGSVC